MVIWRTMQEHWSQPSWVNFNQTRNPRLLCQFMENKVKEECGNSSFAADFHAHLGDNFLPRSTRRFGGNSRVDSTNWSSDLEKNPRLYIPILDQRKTTSESVTSKAIFLVHESEVDDFEVGDNTPQPPTYHGVITQPHTSPKQADVYSKGYWNRGVAK